MTCPDDAAEDVEAEIRRVLDSLPPGGIAQGASEVRRMTAAAAKEIKARYPEQPVLIMDEPDEHDTVAVMIGPVPVVTKFED